MLEKKGYTLVEEVTTPASGFETVGVLYADLVAYLSARIETISNDAELFEGILPEMLEKNAKLQKLKTSTELIGRIKKLDRHVIDESKVGKRAARSPGKKGKKAVRKVGRKQTRKARPATRVNQDRPETVEVHREE